MFAKSVFQTVLKLYCFHCAAAVKSLTLWILKAALIRASVSEASYSWQVKATVLFTALAARDLCTLKHMVTLSVVLAERCEEAEQVRWQEWHRFDVKNRPKGSKACCVKVALAV